MDPTSLLVVLLVFIYLTAVVYSYLSGGWCKPQKVEYFSASIHEELNGDKPTQPDYGADQMSTRISKGKARLITLTPRDSQGNPTVIDGQVTWEVENVEDSPAVEVQVVEDTRGLQAWIIGAELGFAIVTAKGDADLDPDEDRIIAFQTEIIVSPPEAIELDGVIGEESNGPRAAD